MKKFKIKNITKQIKKKINSFRCQKLFSKQLKNSIKLSVYYNTQNANDYIKQNEINLSKKLP